MRIICWLGLITFFACLSIKAQDKAVSDNKNYQLGQDYLNEKWRYDSAYYYLNKAVFEIEQKNELQSLATVLDQLIEFQKSQYFELADASLHLNMQRETLKKCCPDTSSLLINYYLNKGLYELQIKQEDHQVYHDSAMVIIKQRFAPNHISYSKYYLSQYYALAQKGEYDVAMQKLESARKVVEESDINNDELKGRIYYELGLIKRIYRELDAAIVFYQKALEVKNKLENKAVIGQVLTELAYLFSRQGDFKTAEKYYLEAFALYEKHLTSSHDNTNQCACDLAGLYTAMGSHSKAQILLEKTAKIEEEKILAGKAKIITVYKCLGNLIDHYRIVGQTESAIKTNLKLISFVETKEDDYTIGIYVPIIHLKLAKSYRANGQFELAHQSAQKALKTKKEAYPKTRSRYFDIYNELAMIGLEGQLEYDPITYIDSAIYVLKDKTELITNKALVLKTKTDILFKQGTHDEVIAISDSILSMLNRQEQANTFKDIARPELYLAVMEQKAKSLANLEEQNESIVWQTLKEYQKTFEYTNEYLQYLSNENSISTYAASIDTLFDPGMSLALDLYVNEGNEEVFYSALQFAEAHKSIGLQTRVNSLKSRAELRIPEEVIEYEKELKAGIGYLKNRVHQARKSGGFNSKKSITTWGEKLRELDWEFMVFSDSIYRQYPHYYQLKYDYTIPTLAEIKGELLEDEQALLSYKVVGNTVYGLCVSNHHQAFVSVAVPEGIELGVGELLQAITDNNAEWVERSHQLYQALIADFKLPDNINRLLIIPDGILNYLPFELLVQQAVTEQAPNQLDYMIKDYEISYAYSLKHLWDVKARESRSYENQLAAFSPDYEGFEVDQGLLEEEQDGQLLAMLRSGGMALPFAEKETQEISKLYGGQVFSGGAANKENFENSIGRSSILHLAMHAVVDNEDPLYSKLLFAPKNDLDSNHYLNAYELLNMEINADMVVLSACNTGFGQLQAGEGVMSLSRAFAYAGCPSTVMSLWKVPDNSTYQIMLKFYEELEKGSTKSEALRQAKLYYLRNLESAEMANPFWWAGFVAVGDMQPVPMLKKASWLWWLFLLPLFLILGWIFRSRYLTN